MDTAGPGNGLKDWENAMAFVPIPQGMRIALEFDLNGQLCLNVYYVTKATPIVSADLTAIAEVFKDWWTTNASDFLASNLFLERIFVQNMDTEDGEQIVFTDDLPAAGGIGAATSTNQVALCVSRLSTFAGRSNRGRVYIPGIANSSITNNEVSTTVHAGLVSAHNSLNTAIFTAGYLPVIASFISEGEERPFAQTRLISSWAANNRIDTQRRRLPGEGT